MQTRGTRTRRLTAGVSALAIGVGLAMLPGSASAKPVNQTAGPAEVCLPGDGAPPASGPHGRAEPERTQRQVQAMDAEMRQRLAAKPKLAQTSRAASPIHVKVAVHTIKKHKKDNAIGPERIRKMIDILNGAYSGAQSKTATNTRFRFKLESMDWTVNKKWHKAEPDTKAERDMKRALHRGNAATLNIYLLEPANSMWATGPADARKNLKMDGVVIMQSSLWGGSLEGYDRGDGVVHEVGHWLGLEHIFEGGCSAYNDGVSDTPAERTPAYQTCKKGRDTCPNKDGLDPIHNFMDYSPDLCATEFTRGQNERMVLHWLAYRR
jgi:hypothetical protein